MMIDKQIRSLVGFVHTARTDLRKDEGGMMAVRLDGHDGWIWT